MNTKNVNIQLVTTNINDFKGLLDVFEEVFQWVDSLSYGREATSFIEKHKLFGSSSQNRKSSSRRFNSLYT